MRSLRTKVYRASPNNINEVSIFFEEHLDECVETLRAGGVIVFPTETLYGLGVDIYNDSALDRVIELKGRPKNMPIAVAVSNKDQAARIGTISGLASDIIDKCLPMPITILVPVKSSINSKLTSGSDLIGLRFPDHPVTKALLEKFGPITATSANLHGAGDTSTIEPIIEQFQDLVDIYIDSGKCRYSMGSTVVDTTKDTIKIIRYGACSGEELEQCLKGTRRS